MSAPTTGYNVSSGPLPGMRIPNPLPLQANGQARPFTVEHWYYLHELPSNAGLLGTLIPGQAFNTVGINLYFRTQAGQGLRLGIAGSDIRIGNAVIGEWTHIAWVFTGTQGEVWHNGSMVGSGNISNSNLHGSAPFWHAQFNSSSPIANCDIARLRFWDKALTGAEIQVAMNAVHLPMGTPGLMAEYQFDTGNATELPSTYNAPAQLLGNSEQVPRSVSGIITDHNGHPAQRTVRLIHRDTGALVAQGQSDPIAGEYTLTTTRPGEHQRIVLGSDDPLYNDLIDRIIPG